MGVYASTIVADVIRDEKISKNMGIVSGTCDITNYNQTGAEITDITKYFKSILRVICDGVSDNGYIIRWNTTDKAFHAFYPAAFYGPADIDGVTVGTPALVHNADPTGNLAALPLYGAEGYGAGGRNILQLFSTTNGNSDIVGSVDGVSGIIGAATPRFYVNDSDAPSGVKIYVVDGSPWGLEFVSPTASDAYIIMPFEAIADGVPGYAYAVKVTHATDAATGVELEFDDNGAADAQLVFVDGSTTSRVINSADIEVLAPGYMAITTGGVSDEVANNVDVGEVNFVAFGLA